MGGRERKKEKRNYRTRQSIRIAEFVCLFVCLPLLSRSFPSLGVTVHLISLGCPPHCAHLWTCCGGSSDSNLVLLLCVLASNVSQLWELVGFLLWEFSMSFYIFDRHSLPSWCCGFYLQLIQLLRSFGFCSLPTLPLCFNCGFISTSACGSSTVVCYWGCPGGLGSAPVRARYRSGTAAWIAGVLAAPATQGSWCG